MNTLQHPSDRSGEFAMSANYRQRYHSKPDRCGCEGRRFKRSEPCKHMLLESFIAQVCAEAMDNITKHRAINTPMTAMEIKLMVMRCNLQREELWAVVEYAAPARRKQATINSAWLLAQVQRLEKRVNLIKRMSAPVIKCVNNTQVNKRSQPCEHKRKERNNTFGNRYVSVTCLDCREVLEAGYSRSC